MAQEKTSMEERINKEMLSKLVSSYRQMIHEQTQSVRKMSPLDLAGKMKKESDRKLFLELLSETQTRSFAPAVLKGDTYHIDMPFGHKAHFTVTDVAQGVIFINDKPFKVPEVDSYGELVDSLRKFLNNHKRTSLLDFFITPAYALFSSNISDIIVAHTSGYISVNYAEADLVHDEKHYAKLFHDSLSAEIKKAQAECDGVQNEVNESRINYLSDSVKNVIDSLKFEDNSYSEYLIISGLLKKHAGKTIQDQGGPTVNKKFSFTGEVVKAASVDGKFQALFSSRCDLVVQALLPNAYMPDTRKTFEQYQNSICSGISELKSCYKEIDQIHAKTDQGRRMRYRTWETGSMKVQEGVSGNSSQK